MISFSTEFPLSHGDNGGKFIGAIKYWIVNSPHTKIVSSDIGNLFSDGFHRVDVAHQQVEALATKSESTKFLALRHITNEENIQWITSVVYSEAFGDAWVGVRTSRESVSPTVHLPAAKKPVIVKLLLEQVGGGYDGRLSVGGKPHFLSSNDIDLAAALIEGRAECRLPVVYISRSFAEKIVISPESLASDLAGLAHVIVEPNRPFSRRLQIDVKSENVYGGAIGIYWPDAIGIRKFFLGRNFDSISEIRKSIIEEVRSALLNRRPLHKCTWTGANEAESRRLLEVLKASGSQEVEKYVKIFDEELKSKSDQLKLAEQEIRRLEMQVRGFTSRTPSNSGINISIGREQDFFPDEIMSIVLDSLEGAARNAPSESRRHHVLNEMLANNRASGELHERRERIKAALRGYTTMKKATTDALIDMGFEISEEGKHYKLVYNGDGRYTFSLSKSSSDHRSGLNLASDISKIVF